MNNIYEKQNENEVLLLLFSARKLYNRASILNTLLWCAALTSVLLSNNGYVKEKLGYYIIVIPVILTFATNFLQNMINSTIQLGASTKELIDRTLFNFTIPKEIGGYTKEELYERAIKERDKHTKEYATAIKNTGRDKSKGVRNWYEGIMNKEGNEAILACQKENAWYDKKISRAYAGVCVVILIALISLIILFIQKNSQGFPILVIICSYMSLLRKIYTDLKKYQAVKNYALSMEVAIENAEISSELTSDVLDRLQKYIYQRRLIHFTPFNLIHSFYALKLHNVWKEKGKYE